MKYDMDTTFQNTDTTSQCSDVAIGARWQRWQRCQWAFAAVLIACALLFSAGLLSSCETDVASNQEQSTQSALPAGQVDLSQIPEYTDKSYVEINGNEPVFTDEELSRGTFETYSELDDLGRCGTAFALIGEELMPHEERQDIRDVHPSGWHQRMYDFIDGEAVYNRSHLIAFKLAGENANEKNLITGTRYCNATGMAEFEDMVSDYVWNTGNHVLYRVTPIFYEDELVARGVHMEAQSIETDDISFNVYVYNVQPGVIIDYETGENWLEEGNEGYIDFNSPYKPA